MKSDLIPRVKLFNKHFCKKRPFFCASVDHRFVFLTRFWDNGFIAELQETPPFIEVLKLRNIAPYDSPWDVEGSFRCSHVFHVVT